MMETWLEQQLLVRRILINPQNSKCKASKALSIPRVGDIVIGSVAAVMSSMIAVTIEFINVNQQHQK